jgi:GT2 family glycosyltransferase
MPGEDHGAPAARLIAGRPSGPYVYDADIIILSLDRLTETTAAIRSALAQRGGTFHVTVLDQGSAPEALRTLARTFAKSAALSIYTSEQNLGVAGGRNLASSLGHGELIVALDNDAVFQGEWVIARAANCFRRNPDLGALGFAVLAADGIHPDLSSWGYPNRLLKRIRDRFDTTTFVGAGHAIRRVTWQAAGGYDPAFFFTWEEYDFCLSAIALKWRIRYDGSLAVVHKVSPAARVSWNDTRLTYFVRNRLLISRKWSASQLGLLPRIALYLFRGLLSRRLAATLAGIRAAWFAEPSTRRRMSAEMRKYLQLNETRHRGSWLTQFQHELTRQRPTDSHQDHSAKG